MHTLIQIVAVHCVCFVQWCSKVFCEMRCIDICNHSDAQARKNIRIRSCDMPSCQTTTKMLKLSWHTSPMNYSPCRSRPWNLIPPCILATKLRRKLDGHSFWMVCWHAAAMTQPLCPSLSEQQIINAYKSD